jgi:hypothetical protein
LKNLQFTPQSKIFPSVDQSNQFGGNNNNMQISSLPSSINFSSVNVPHYLSETFLSSLFLALSSPLISPSLRFSSWVLYFPLLMSSYSPSFSLGIMSQPSTPSASVSLPYLSMSSMDNKNADVYVLKTEEPPPPPSPSSSLLYPINLHYVFFSLNTFLHLYKVAQTTDFILEKKILFTKKEKDSPDSNTLSVTMDAGDGAFAGHDFSYFIIPYNIFNYSLSENTNSSFFSTNTNDCRNNVTSDSSQMSILLYNSFAYFLINSYPDIKTSFDIISKDVSRTVSQLFSSSESSNFHHKKLLLKCALQMIAVSNPELRYTQGFQIYYCLVIIFFLGMSYPAALLFFLHPCDFYSAFGILFNTLNTPFITALYSMDELFLSTTYAFFSNLLNEYLPHLHTLFSFHGIAFDFLISWFSSFFLRSFSADIAVIVFNGFLIDGPSFFFCAALASLFLLFPDVKPEMFVGDDFEIVTAGSDFSHNSQITGLDIESIMDFDTVSLRISGIVRNPGKFSRSSKSTSSLTSSVTSSISPSTIDPEKFLNKVRYFTSKIPRREKFWDLWKKNKK